MGELCQPSDNLSLFAMALGGSVSAGLRYSVRQDPHNTLYHAQVAERLSRRLGGRTEMWNGAVPAMGPWIANACTQVWYLCGLMGPVAILVNYPCGHHQHVTAC